MSAAVLRFGRPCFIVAELGINHNGSLDRARRLVDAAKAAGADAVKLQMGTPARWIPRAQWCQPRRLEDGRQVSYLDYRRSLEFDSRQWGELVRHCERVGVVWFASALDVGAVKRLDALGATIHKVASCMVTNRALLEAMHRSGKPVIMSTGMSTLDQLRRAAGLLGDRLRAILHTVSVYPMPNGLANLRCMKTLREAFPGVPVGYSGHEVGLQITLAAVALGAELVERHITLSRAGWGSDQAASVEPDGFRRLVRDIRVIEAALGDGVKRLLPEEEPNMKKLRKPAEPAGGGS